MIYDHVLELQHYTPFFDNSADRELLHTFLIHTENAELAGAELDFQLTVIYVSRIQRSARKERSE